MNDEFDDLNAAEGLLVGAARPASNEALRKKLLATTSVKVCRRRTVRRAGWLAAVAVAYLAGLATQQMFRTAPSTNAPMAVATTRQPTTGTDEIENSERPEDLIEIGDLAARRPEAIDPATAYERFRKAGDRQLLGRGDLAAAVRLYRRALGAASPAELKTINLDDTWLLSALKANRQQQTSENSPHADDTL